MKLFSKLFFTGMLAGLASWSSLQAEEKWVECMTGKDLGEHWTTTGNWVYENGVAALKPRAGEKGWTRYDAYLWLKSDALQNFEVEFEYNMEKSSNSGFYFHVGDVKNPVSSGIEVQLYDSFGKPAGKPLTDHDSGGIIPGVPPTKNSAKAPGEWNKFQITCRDDKLTVMLNGETVNELNLAEGKTKDRPKTGAIGFQDHGLPLSLRNFRFRKI
jgi:Domain of Unknown Function (DUF1080)